MKNWVFQIHWFLGITAGVVLAVVGGTGALMSFEKQIMDAISPGIATVALRQDVSPLEPDALLARFRADHPKATVEQITLSSEVGRSAQVRVASASADRRERPPTLYLNPYTGETLGTLNGQGFFRTVLELHRWLLVPRSEGSNIGRQITGFSAIALVYFALSGLYMRWPRRPLDWRNWFRIDFSLKGRSFYWALHSVIGTWVLVVYLLLALTGLSWSYSWYKTGLSIVLTGEAPPARGERAPGAAGGERGQERGQGERGQGAGGEQRMAGERGFGADGERNAGAGREPGANGEAARSQFARGGEGARGERGAGDERFAGGEPGERGARGEGGERNFGGEAGGERRGRGEGQATPQAAPATEIAWKAFLAKTEGRFQTASITIPKTAREAFAINYIGADALHDRQRSSMSVNREGEVVKFQPYTPVEPLGKRINQSMYELHVGDWFGTTGRIVNMVASILMPLFTITGFLLYFDRRKKKRDTKQALKAIGGGAAKPTDLAPDYLVVYASQSGTSERLAWHTANILNSGGVGASVKSLADINTDVLTSSQKVLFLLSTFGEGEAPDMARGFIKKHMKANATLDNLRFGLLALGDKCYRDYCGFAIEVEQWLISSGASSIFERINVDNHDETAIQQWEKEIAKLGGVTEIAQRQEVEYAPWTLASRRLLNAGSIGNAIYSVSLTPAELGDDAWQAGDILEIKPQHDPAKVEQFLTEHKLDGNQLFNGVTLRELIATHVLPTSQPSQNTDLAALIASLKPLAKREYSIASLPSDGSVELVIRQAFNESGVIGLGSGWLTSFVAEGGQVFARVRSNPSFHAHDHNGPIIFIGAGTGIAGLRSHLRARDLAGDKQNWLVFGERHRAHDRLYGDELDGWIGTDVLQHLDEVFSRDDGIYVQHRLVAEQRRVREWLNNGAAILICGSLTGMAAGVEQALIEILGQAEFDALRDSGRYRRDVY